MNSEQLGIRLGFASSAEDEIDLRNTGPLGGGEPRTAQITGTRALMLAVLEDAIRCYLDGRNKTAEEACEWIGSNARRSVFTFVVVCETLGLDPTATRRMLREMKSSQVASRQAIPRARKNVRVPGRVHPRKTTERRTHRRVHARAAAV